MNVVQTVL